MIVICPSRERPDNIVALRDAIASTATEPVPLVVGVDGDDPRLEQYKAIDGITLVVGPAGRLGPWLNLLALNFTGDQRVIGFLGDDHRPRTRGWNEAVVAAAGRKGIVYGNDLFQGANLPTAVFITRNIIEALGYMVPKGIIHLFADNAWKVLGEQGECLTYLSAVVIEHCHPFAGKTEEDESYKRNNGVEVYNHDEMVFDQWRTYTLPTAARTIKNL